MAQQRAAHKEGGVLGEGQWRLQNTAVSDYMLDNPG